MSKQRLTSQNITTIIIATIGVIGSVTVAYFAFRGNTAPIELSISATQTAEASKALNPTTLIDTLGTTPTEILPTPTSTITPKQDFSTNCINATDWTPSPESATFAQENNCWDLSSKGIAAQNGILFFVVENDIPQSGSLYTPIQKNSVIKFKVKIDAFNSGETNGNLVFGVSTVDDWLIKGEYLFLRATDSGYFLVSGNSVLEEGNFTIESYKIGSGVDVVFQFNTLAFDIYVNGTKIVSNIPLSTSDSQVFWIGYRLRTNSKLVASVSDFRIEK